MGCICQCPTPPGGTIECPDGYSAICIVVYGQPPVGKCFPTTFSASELVSSDSARRKFASKIFELAFDDDLRSITDVNPDKIAQLLLSSVDHHGGPFTLTIGIVEIAIQLPQDDGKLRETEKTFLSQ